MIKYIFVVILLISEVTVIRAQRMIPGQKGLEINLGLLSKKVSDNCYLNLILTTYGKSGGYWLWGAEYDHRLVHYEELPIPLENYTGELGYSFQLLSDIRKTITLNLGLIALAGYEIINRSEAVLYDGSKILDKDHFIYGTIGQLSLETYLSDRFVLLLQGRGKVVWGTDLKQFRPSVSLGLRFNL